MSSFSLVLVEEGVEVEIPGDLTSVVSLLDEEVPWFSHAGHEYQLTPGRTELGVRWDLSIKLINSVHRDRDRPTVGHIELEAQDPGEVVFRIPPWKACPNPPVTTMSTSFARLPPITTTYGTNLRWSLARLNTGYWLPIAD